MLADALRLQRQLFFPWTRGTEATLKAGFEAQNAAITASITCIAAVNAAHKHAAEQWQGALHQQQKAVLGAWETGTRTVESMLSGPATAD
jgi:hypothetical protein